MLDLFEWGTERLGLLSMSLYIAYFQSIEYFLSATSSISYIVCFLSIHLDFFQKKNHLEDLQLNSKVMFFSPVLIFLQVLQQNCRNLYAIAY